MLNFIAKIILRKELERLHRYQLACTELERWFASHPQSVAVVKHIHAFGEGTGALNPSDLREELYGRNVGLRSTMPALPRVSPPPPVPPEVEAPPLQLM